jgi:hypothetical protein
MILSDKINEIWHELDKEDTDLIDCNKILEHITSDDDLLNIIHPEENLSLFTNILMLSKKEGMADIIKYMVKNKKLELNNTNCRTTNIDEIISLSTIDTIQLLKKENRLGELVFNKEKLTYKSVREKLEAATNTYNKDCKNKLKAHIIARSKTRMDRFKDMLETLRVATIIQAIQQDNLDLLEQLEQSGGDAVFFWMEDNDLVLPQSLLTEENTKVKKFYEEKRKLYELEINKYKEGIEEKKILNEKEINDEYEKYLKKQITVTRNLLDKRVNETGNTVSALKKNTMFTKNDTIKNNNKMDENSSTEISVVFK